MFASQGAPLVSTTPTANFATNFASVVDKIIKTFMTEDFFHMAPVPMTPVVHIELRISPRIFEKFEMALMVYSGAWGKLIHEKNQKSKIS
jgi:hypothetical protein